MFFSDSKDNKNMLLKSIECSFSTYITVDITQNKLETSAYDNFSRNEQILVLIESSPCF